MTTLVAGLLGAVAGLGVLLLVVSGVRGVPAGTLGSRGSPTGGDVSTGSTSALALALGPRSSSTRSLAGRSVPLPVSSSGFTAPTLIGARAKRRREVERIEAVARWAEQLRDTMSAAAGLHEAFGVTARVAPLAIRTEVQELAPSLRHDRCRALRRFAAQLASPAGDQVAVALLLASERHGARLSDVLSRVAAAAEPRPRSGCGSRHSGPGRTARPA